MDPIEDDDGPMGFKDSEWEEHAKVAGRIGITVVVILVLAACISAYLVIAHFMK